MRFWRKFNPAGAVADFIAVWHQAGRARWLFMGLAAITTIGIFSMIVREETPIPPRLPQITYINSWSADRSEAEILASNRVNQAAKDDLAARQAAADAEVRHIYKVIGRASGMDVDAIERQARADDARDAEAAKAKQAALYAAEQRAAASEPSAAAR